MSREEVCKFDAHLGFSKWILRVPLSLSVPVLPLLLSSTRHNCKPTAESPPTHSWAWRYQVVSVKRVGPRWNPKRLLNQHWLLVTVKKNQKKPKKLETPKCAGNLGFIFHKDADLACGALRMNSTNVSHSGLTRVR